MVAGRGWGIAFPVFVMLGSWACPPLEGTHQTGPGPLRLQLDVPAEVSKDKTVHLKLKVKNVSQRAIEQAFGGRPCYDFVVSTPDGTEVWRWLHGKVVQEILEMKTLRPGQEVEFTAEWNQRDNNGSAVSPGKYQVVGVLNTDPPEKLQTKPQALMIRT